MNSKRVRALIATGVFFAMLTVLWLTAAPLQWNFGLIGLAGTELIVLAFALLAPLAQRMNFREVFPFHVPKLRQIFGTLITWAGFFFLATLISQITMCLFEQQMNQIGEYMGSFMSSLPFWPALLITAVLPALCEEAFFRGYLYSSFQGMRREWLRILILSLFFGLFHMDPYRFFITMVPGIGLYYVMMRTQNLVLPMLFHFVNNALSTVVCFYVPTVEQSGPVMFTNVQLLGAFLIYYCCFPFLLVLGGMLLRQKKETKKTVHAVIAAGIAAAVSCICGFLFLLG